MHHIQHTSQDVEALVRSPFSVGGVDTNPLIRRDSMVGSHWTCGTAVEAFEASGKTSPGKTSEGDSNTAYIQNGGNTESEVASA